MERLLVFEQSVDDYLALVTRVTPLNESLFIIILGSYLLIVVTNELLMNGKMLFLQMNPILRFLTKKSRSFVCLLLSEVDAPFNFQEHVKVEVVQLVFGRGMTTAKGVDPLVFYAEQLDGPTSINIIKNHLLPYIKKVSNKMIDGIVFKILRHVISQLLL